MTLNLYYLESGNQSTCNAIHCISFSHMWCKMHTMLCIFRYITCLFLRRTLLKSSNFLTSLRTSLPMSAPMDTAQIPRDMNVLATGRRREALSAAMCFLFTSWEHKTLIAPNSWLLLTSLIPCCWNTAITTTSHPNLWEDGTRQISYLCNQSLMVLVRFWFCFFLLLLVLLWLLLFLLVMLWLQPKMCLSEVGTSW